MSSSIGNKKVSAHEHMILKPLFSFVLLRRELEPDHTEAPAGTPRTREYDDPESGGGIGGK